MIFCLKEQRIPKVEDKKVQAKKNDQNKNNNLLFTKPLKTLNVLFYNLYSLRNAVICIDFVVFLICD